MFRFRPTTSTGAIGGWSVFDMDSTLIQAEVIDELAKEAGVGDEVAAITAAAMQGARFSPESDTACGPAAGTARI
jgi:phosphoserine phosphatase